MNVGFQLMRTPTDLARMALLSDAGVNLKTFPYDAIKIAGAWASSIKSTFLKDPKWQEALRTGALFSGAQRNINPEHFVTTQFLDAPWKRIANRIIDTPADLNAAVEDTIKLTAYQRLRAQGESVKAATYETKRYGGSPDYSRKGNLSPVANLVTMFFNADMQHISQAFEKVGKNPERMVPILGAITAAQMALAQYNWSKKDDKGEPLMRRVPYSVREKDWVFLTEGVNAAGVPNMFRLRKPDFVGIFVNPIDNVVERVAGKEERSGAQIALDGLSHLVPGAQMQIDPKNPVSSTARGLAAGLNPGIRVPIEQVANKQFGINAPIVNKPQLAPEAQVGKNTSPLAKAVGSKLGISPQRVDHVLRGLTGNVSDEVQNALTGHFGKLTSRFVAGNFNQADKNTTDQFYAGINKAIEAKTTYEHFMQTDPTQARQYMLDHQGDVLNGHLTDGMQKRISDFSQMEQMLQERAKTDPKAQEAIANIHEAKMTLMKSYAHLLNQNQ
jgi:hypothetical protein